MKGLKKSKSVTWATGPNLCQVKFFLSEDSPSKVRVETQHHHQSKTSNSNLRSFDKFPAWYVNPLRGSNHVDSSKGKLSCIPQIKWKSPPEFALDINWRVAAGEESGEVKVQKDRETTVREAIYPHLSAISPSPSISLDEEDRCYDDSRTPLIPIIPIEEAAADAEMFPSDAMEPLVLPMNYQPPSLSHGPSSSATPSISWCTMNSQLPSLTLGPSRSADLSISSQPTSISQGPSTSANSDLPQCTMNLEPPSLSHHLSTSATPNLSRCSTKSQPPSLSQRPFTSATPNISLCTMMSQRPSPSLSPSTSAAPCILQRTMNAQPASLSQLPSTFATPVIPQCTMNSQPSSIPQGPSTSTTLHTSHCNFPETQNPPACEKSLMFDGLDSNVVDAVTVAATEIAKSREQGSLIDTDLLVKFLSDPKMIEILMKKQGLAPNTKTKTPSGCNLGPSSVSLPCSMPDLSIKKATNEQNEPANNRTEAIYRPVIVSRSLPWPSTKTEVMASKSTEEHEMEAKSTSVSGRHFPLPRAKPEVLPDKVIEGHVGAYCGIDTKAISRPVISPTFPSIRTEGVHSKFTEKHGERHAGISLVYGSKPAAISVPVPPSKHDVSLSKNFNSGKEQREPAYTGTQTISRPVISYQFPPGKAEIVGNKLIEEHGRSHAAPPVYRTKPMAKSVQSPKPEVSLGKSFVNEYKSPAHIAGAQPAVRPDVEKIKKLINEYGAADNAGQNSSPAGRQNVEIFKKMINVYGAPDNAGQKSLLAGSQNVEILKKMISAYGAPDNAGKKSLPSSEPTLLPPSRTKPDMVVSPGANLYTLPNTQPNLHRKSLSPSPAHTPPFSSLKTSAPPLKDINYYKSLIKQHGENQETSDRNLSRYGKPHNPLRESELVQNLKPTDEHNARHKKPCMYFHSPRGCRYGSSCPYLHDDTSKLSRPGSVLETPGTKRIKLVGNS